MTMRILLGVVVIAILSFSTGCLFRNHGNCDSKYEDSRRYDSERCR